MPVFRRRRNRPILSAILIVIGNFFFSNDAKTDKYYTDDALMDPLIHED